MNSTASLPLPTTMITYLRAECSLSVTTSYSSSDCVRVSLKTTDRFGTSWLGSMELITSDHTIMRAFLDSVTLKSIWLVQRGHMDLSDLINSMKGWQLTFANTSSKRTRSEILHSMGVHPNSPACPPHLDSDSLTSETDLVQLSRQQQGDLLSQLLEMSQPSSPPTGNPSPWAAI